MIKVLQCVSNMDRAGIETMLMNYYRNINKDEIQFYFLCNKPQKGAYDEEIKKMGGKVFYTPGLNPIKALKYHKYVKKIINENNIDIIHVHNGAFGLQALIAAKSANIKVRISHAHGTRIDYNYKLPLKLIYKTQLKKYANYFWGCGKEAIRYYYGEKMNSSKYYILTNAIDFDKFKYNDNLRNKIRNKYNIKDNEILIGHIGRFMSQKNHNYIIDIFNELYKESSNYKLILIGDGELKDKIRKRIKENNLQSKIIMTGNIPNVNEFYSAMDCFILPSLFEGLPVVGIEAQANGLPCIFSNTVSEEVRITNNVSFIDINKKNITEWINEIKRKNKIRIKINNELSKNNYLIKDETIKLEKKYKEILLKENNK